MSKIKFLWAFSPEGLDEQIKKWVDKENPTILSSSVSTSRNYSAISITYNENPEKEIQYLLKS